jgi:hypothetical protein
VPNVIVWVCPQCSTTYDTIPWWCVGCAAKGNTSVSLSKNRFHSPCEEDEGEEDPWRVKQPVSVADDFALDGVHSMPQVQPLMERARVIKSEGGIHCAAGP